MKNTIVITVVLVLSVCATRADAQATSFKRAFISAGAAFPAAPDQFYDYWKTGWSLAGGLEFGLAPQLRLDVSGTYSRFGFDEERFFKRLKLDGSTYSVSGGAGTMATVTGDVHYLVPGYEWVRPSFFGGVGFLMTSRAASTVNYAGMEEKKDGTSSVILCVPVGFRLAKAYSDKIDVVLDFRYLLGVSKAQEVNSNASSISLGVAIVP